MGICPRCGSWVDEGEPYCPECCYGGSNGHKAEDVKRTRDDFIHVNGYLYDADDVEDALDELGYDMDDFESGLVDEDELEELLDEWEDES